MPTHISALFLLIFALTAASSWLLQTLFGAAPQAATEIHDTGISPEISPNTQKMLGSLESLLADFTAHQNNSDSLTDFKDFGTRLDIIFEAGTAKTLGEINWSYIDLMLVQSFPARDIKTALHILACYRRYRLELENLSTAATPDLDRHRLRVRYFGSDMADILFAAEYQMLAALNNGSLENAPVPLAEAISDCFSSGGN